MDMTPSDSALLEQLVDRYSMPEVIASLAVICSEKADHIRTSYADISLARGWDTASRLLGCVSERRALLCLQ